MARSRNETHKGIWVPAGASPAWIYSSGDLGNRSQRGISEVVLATRGGWGEAGAPGKPESGKADREQDEIQDVRMCPLASNVRQSWECTRPLL